MPSSRSRDLIQSTSAVTEAITRYYASVENMDFCFLEDQKMTLVPRKTT